MTVKYNIKGVEGEVNVSDEIGPLLGGEIAFSFIADNLVKSGTVSEDELEEIHNYFCSELIRQTGGGKGES